jgi:hypothetical protein
MDKALKELRPDAQLPQTNHLGTGKTKVGKNKKGNRCPRK